MVLCPGKKTLSPVCLSSLRPLADSAIRLAADADILPSNAEIYLCNWLNVENEGPSQQHHTLNHNWTLNTLIERLIISII